MMDTSTSVPGRPSPRDRTDDASGFCPSRQEGSPMSTQADEELPWYVRAAIAAAILVVVFVIVVDVLKFVSVI